MFIYVSRAASVTESAWFEFCEASDRHTSEMHGNICDQMLRDGYVVLEDFLTAAECDELAAAGLDLTKNLPDQRSIFSTTDTPQNKDEYFMQSNDKISHFFEKDAVGPDGELVVDPSICLNKVGHALHYQHPVFRCYTYCERVRAACRALGLREPAVVQSMFIYKNPGVGSEVVAHQDATYLYTDPTPPIGFWIALDDATIQNGCLWMVPGSHKSGVHRRLIRNPEKIPALIADKPSPVYPESSFTPVPVKKGTCVLLHGNVVHRSAPNKSGKSRYAYTFHVIEKYKNNFSAENWLQEGPNAPFVNLYTTKQII